MSLAWGLSSPRLPVLQLRRLHFHDFMLEIHSMLRQYSNQQDPLARVGEASAAKMRVLCLDELFVTDVADATILNRLFSSMWDLGITLVATSNRYLPSSPYRASFASLTALLCCVSHSLPAANTCQSEFSRLMHGFFSPRTGTRTCCGD